MDHQPFLIVAFFTLFFGCLLYLYRKLASVYQDNTLLNKKMFELTAQMNRHRLDAAEKEAELKSGTAFVGQRYSVIFLKIKEILLNLDATAVTKNTLDLMQRFMNVRTAQIFITKEGGQVLAIYKEIGDNLVDRGDVGVGEKTMIGYSAEKRMALFLNEVQTEQSLKGLVRKGRYGTVMCAPLIHRGRNELLGLINVESMVQDYTQDDRHLFQLLVSVAEVALQNTHLLDKTKLEGKAIAREKEEIRNIASRYVSSRVVDDILKSKKFELGGTKLPVAILVSDVRGFTKMAERLAPEQVVEILNDYFMTMGVIVEEHGGYLDKFIGDAMMVLFGVSETTGREALSAVRAAVGMQEATLGFERKWRDRVGEHFSFNVGIGINAGDVIVGNIGSEQKMNYTAIGDDVNVAFRLESIAPGGKIYISEAVRARASGEVTVRQLGDVPVKGRENPVKAFEIVAEKSQWDPLDDLAGNAAPAA